MNLGLFIQIADPKMWMVVNGVMNAAKQNGAKLTIYGCPDEALHARMDRALLKRLYAFDETAHDGLIFAFAGEAMQALAEELWTGGKPVMLIARHRDGIPCTLNNCRSAFCDAVHLMIERGHTQIAFLAGPEETNQSAKDKRDGYLLALEECAIDEDPSLIIPGDYTEESARAHVAEALKKGLNCTALIASNDLGAIGAMSALQEAGISPGADVEILGYDNIPRSRWTKPALSSHEPHYYQLGHVSCAELIRCVQGQSYAKLSEIPATLITRSTTWDARPTEKSGEERAVEWLENRFLYEAQLAILRKEPDAQLLMEKLQGARDTPESFVETYRELLGEATRLGLSAGCLTPLTSFEPRHEREALSLRQCRALQTGVLFEEQKQRTESALRYNTASSRLRDPGLATAKEDAVIAAVEGTLGSLHVHKACIFLNDTPVSLEEPAQPGGEWLWLETNGGIQGDGFRRKRVTGFEPGLREESSESEAWIHIPLMQGPELLGFTLLDAAGEFLPHYPDLVRQFSMALHAGRMQRALAKVNAELVETSRLAGLAEMATGVLHNIGNALNSVNTSCSLMADHVSKSHLGGVRRVAKLLEEHAPDPGAFISKDPKGQQIPGYLSQLGGLLEAEQASMAAELSDLRAMIDHINQIVAAQQSYAQVSGITESVPPEEILEFALRLGEASLCRHGITVRREYSDTLPVRLQRQKAVQILVNLIRNAKESMDEARPAEKFLDLAIGPGRPGFVALSIGDNGLGIAPATLPKMFSFGFTTKPHGHGFGLHNSALAAREMGGFLSATSGGPGKGARFLLELPTGMTN